MDDIDQTATCEHCGADIEHVEGIPGDENMTPYWRHPRGTVLSRPHPAMPDPATVTQVQR